MKRILFFPLLCSLLLAFGGACSEQTTATSAADSLGVADSVELVLRVRQTSRLYTAEYQVHKIITHSDIKRLRATLLGHDYETQLSLGDRKVAIPLDVTLQAYIDFTNFHESQIRRSPDGRQLQVILPDPKVVVVSSKVDHESTRQFTDLLRSDYSDEELAGLTSQGVRDILRQVPQLGILTTARNNAAAILIPLLTSLGYGEQDIVITFRKDFTEQDLPFYYDEKERKMP
jgi:hypothetical protein